jgi:hypothetical protein
MKLVDLPKPHLRISSGLLLQAPSFLYLPPSEAGGGIQGMALFPRFRIPVSLKIILKEYTRISNKAI